MPWMLQHRRLVGSPHVPATAPPPPISGWDLRLKVVRSLDRPACRRIYLTWKAYAPEWREADRSVVRRFGGLVVWWFGGAAVEQWLRRWCGIVRCWAVFFVFTSSFFFLGKAPWMSQARLGDSPARSCDSTLLPTPGMVASSTALFMGCLGSLNKSSCSCSFSSSSSFSFPAHQLSPLLGTAIRVGGNLALSPAFWGLLPALPSIHWQFEAIYRCAG